MRSQVNIPLTWQADTRVWDWTRGAFIVMIVHLVIFLGIPAVFFLVFIVLSEEYHFNCGKTLGQIQIYTKSLFGNSQFNIGINQIQKLVKYSNENWLHLYYYKDRTSKMLDLRFSDQTDRDQVLHFLESATGMIAEVKSFESSD